MKHYRKRNGRYQSKKSFVDSEWRRLKMWTIGIAFMSIVMFIGETSRVEIQAEASNEALPTQEEFVPIDEGLCDLFAVVCEHEEPVALAVQAVSDALGREVTDETKRRIGYLHEKATEAGVPFFDAVKTVYCESQWHTIQSNIVRNGHREESYGLAQIHVPSHKGITPEQAMDAYFAIDFLVGHWYTPQAEMDRMWYGFSRETGRCTNDLTINL